MGTCADRLISAARAIASGSRSKNAAPRTTPPATAASACARPGQRSAATPPASVEKKATAANPTASHVLNALPAGRAEPGKHQVVAGHRETGAFLNFCLRALKEAVRQRRDGAALVTTNVVVMTS